MAAAFTVRNPVAPPTAEPPPAAVIVVQQAAKPAEDDLGAPKTYEVFTVCPNPLCCK